MDDDQAVMKLCCVMSHLQQRAHAHRRSIASAKLKQSQLFERGGIYGIDDALQNRSCPMN